MNIRPYNDPLGPGYGLYQKKPLFASITENKDKESQPAISELPDISIIGVVNPEIEKQVLDNTLPRVEVTKVPPEINEKVKNAFPQVVPLIEEKIINKNLQCVELKYFKVYFEKDSYDKIKDILSRLDNVFVFLSKWLDVDLKEKISIFYFPSKSEERRAPGKTFSDKCIFNNLEGRLHVDLHELGHIFQCLKNGDLDERFLHEPLNHYFHRQCWCVVNNRKFHEEIFCNVKNKYKTFENFIKSNPSPFNINLKEFNSMEREEGIKLQCSIINFTILMYSYLEQKYGKDKLKEFFLYMLGDRNKNVKPQTGEEALKEIYNLTPEQLHKELKEYFDTEKIKIGE